MIKQIDRSLNLFVLALVRAEVNTPYSIRRDAGISLGANETALRKLREKQLIKKSKEGKRGKAEYSLTEKGRVYLENGIPAVFEEAAKKMPRDVESVIRILCIAFDSGYEERAFPIVEQAIEARTSQIIGLSDRTLFGHTRNSELAERYRALVLDKRQAVLTAEREWLVRLRKQMSMVGSKGKKGPRPRRSRKT